MRYLTSVALRLTRFSCGSTLLSAARLGVNHSSVWIHSIQERGSLQPERPLERNHSISTKPQSFFFGANPQVDFGKRALDDRILSLNWRTKPIQPKSERLTPATFRQPPGAKSGGFHARGLKTKAASYQRDLRYPAKRFALCKISGN